MQIDELRELICLMKENQISEIDLEESGRRVRIVATPPAVGIPTPVAVVSTAAEGPGAEVVEAPSMVPVREAQAPTVSGVVITSPIVGTFYRSPSPESPPFIEEGDEVDEGSVLCLIEAMKVMNEIRAEIRGKIVAILAQNGHPVEFGQPLFRLSPAL